MTWTEEADFWRRVSIGDKTECWEWLDRVWQDGFGIMGWKGKITQAHKISWELNYGSEREEVFHTCGNKLCMNPYHLYLKGI